MKNIVVAFDGTSGSLTALDHAMALASRSQGHVTAVLAHSAAERYAEQGHWIPPEARAIIARTNQKIVGDVEAAFGKAAESYGDIGRLSFEAIAGRVDDVLALRARAADLLVVARPGEDIDRHVLEHPDVIALRSGRPLLVVPEGSAPWTEPAPVVVAWDGKRAAARALADALPMLPPGCDVIVLTVGSDTLDRPADEILTHLKRHGFAARHETKGDDRHVSETIISYCTEAQPSLLVMGAYEHSKFQVDLVGGPTVEILRRAALPVLMSH